MAMITSSIKKFVLFIVVCFVPFIVMADVPSWQIVPEESSITFTGTQNNAPVSGKFTKFTGDVKFDPNDLEHSQVKIMIDINSISTSYQDIADALKSSDWFDVKVFPQATFTANQFKKIADHQYEANGTLTIRDKTEPASVKFDVAELSPTKAQVKGTTILKRLIFGVGRGDWGSTDEVKDEVKVDFVLTATKK